MREIKFRWWSEKYKKMVYTYDELRNFVKNKKEILLSNEKDKYLECDEWWDYDYCNHIRFDIEQVGEFIPLQYTGMKDRNGREIYEGDIVELKEKNYIVKFYEGCFVGVDEYDEHYEYTIFLNEAFIRQIKVVGNIYENRD